MTATTMTLAAFCERHKITADVTYGAPPDAELVCDERQREWRRTANGWTVTLKRGRRRLTTPYWTGAAIRGEPEASDVLGCLLLDASGVEAAGGIFRQWCSELGYSDDSRSAHAAWLACCRLLPRLRAFLGDLYDSAQSAEH